MKCSQPECPKPVHCRGLCRAHYRTAPRVRAFKVRPADALCTVAGCSKPYVAKGLCGQHYHYLWMYGDASIRVRPRREDGARWEYLGYVYIRVNGKKMLEHRHLMEQKLGRKLIPKENVHHINGDKTDNRIENLELWSKSQPSGQRVADKVVWAREIIRLYGHLG